jgi:hypothetical protein
MAEEKPGQNLEQKVNDRQSKGFIRKAFDFGFNVAAAAATTALGFATVGMAAPIIASAFAGGGMVGSLISKRKTGDSLYNIINNTLKTYASVNTVLYPMFALGALTWPVVGKMGADIAGAAGRVLANGLYSVTAYNWVFTTLFKGAYHLYDNKFNPEGIGKSITTDFWPVANRFTWIFAPGYFLASNGIGTLNIGGFGLPTFAANAFPAAIYGSINPPEAAKAKAVRGKQYQPAYQQAVAPQYTPGMQPQMAAAPA